MFYLLISELNGYKCVEMLLDDEEKAYRYMHFCAEFCEDENRIWYVEKIPLNECWKPNHMPDSVFA